MDFVRNFLGRSSITVKTLMAVSITSAFVVVYKSVYAPYVRRRRYSEAEAWASYILKEEERLKLEGKDLANMSHYANKAG